MRFQHCTIHRFGFLLCAAAVILQFRLCANVAPWSQDARCQDLHFKESKRRLHHCSRVDPWWLSYVIRPRVVTVACPEKMQFSVCVGASKLNLFEPENESHQCRSFKGPAPYIARFSPYEDTKINISTEGPIQISKCRITVRSDVSSEAAIFILSGLCLFFFSGILSRSTTFRLISGTVLFILTAMLIATYLIMRSASQGARLFTFLLFIGATSFTAFRMMLMHRLPSIGSLLHNEIVVAYIVVSGLVGLALSYYFDDPTNVKLTRILQVGLQIIGLALIYYALIQQQLATSVVALLLTFEYVVKPISDWLWQRRQCGVKWECMAQNNQLSTVVTRDKGGKSVHGQCGSWGKQLDVSSKAMSQGHGALAFSGIQEKSDKEKALICQKSRVHSDTGEKAGVTAMVKTEDDPAAMLTNTADAANVDDMNPIVRQGLILNPLSGRTIQIGKQRYKELVEQGFKPNFKDGVLERPPKKVR